MEGAGGSKFPSTLGEGHCVQGLPSGEKGKWGGCQNRSTLGIEEEEGERERKRENNKDSL